MPGVTEERRVRVGRGVAAALALAPAVFALVSALDQRAQPEADPGSVIWSERSVFLGRVSVAAFVTALLATGLVALSGGAARRAGARFAWACGVSALAALSRAAGLW